MALSWLFPKDKAQPTASTSTPAPSDALPVDHTAPPRSSIFDDDNEQMPGRDKDGRRKLPPVALYVSGAAVSESSLPGAASPGSIPLGAGAFRRSWSSRLSWATRCAMTGLTPVCPHNRSDRSDRALCAHGRSIG